MGAEVVKLTFLRNVPLSNAQIEVARLRRNGKDAVIGKPQTEHDVGRADLAGIYLVEDDNGPE